MKWIIIVLLLSVAPAWAQEPRLSDKEVQAWNEVQEELTACVAYFNFGKNCAPIGKEEEAKQMDPTIEHMMTLALTVGSRIGMTQDAMLSRLKMTLEDQAKLTEGKCLNFASLLTRYASRCKLLGEHPEAVFLEHMKK
jgi:hypothetical protein